MAEELPPIRELRDSLLDVPRTAAGNGKLRDQLLRTRSRGNNRMQEPNPDTLHSEENRVLTRSRGPDSLPRNTTQRTTGKMTTSNRMKVITVSLRGDQLDFLTEFNAVSRVSKSEVIRQCLDRCAPDLLAAMGAMQKHGFRPATQPELKRAKKGRTKK